MYISDPDISWKFWSPLKIGENGLSIAIALQKDQAIALLLKKQNAVGNRVTVNEKGAKVKVRFGSVTTMLGQKLNETESTACKEYELELSENLRRTDIKRDFIEK